MGVPVISKRDRPPLGRFGDAILAPLALGDWVADDEKSYVEIAVQKTRDLEVLARLRSSLRGEMQRSEFCDYPSLARQVEQSFLCFAQKAQALL